MKKLLTNFVLAIWNFIVTLFTSSREILFTALVLIGLIWVSDVSADWAKQEKLGFLALGSLFAGVVKFCSIMLTVWVIGIGISFPNTIGKFVNKGFEDTFANLSPREGLYVTLGIAGFLTIVATVCFVL